MDFLSFGIAAIVTAYCKTTPTATGRRPSVGMCAGPRSQLGKDVIIKGKRYHIEDIDPRGHYDIWMPTRRQCRQWGRKRLAVRVIRRSHPNTSQHGARNRHSRVTRTHQRPRR